MQDSFALLLDSAIYKASIPELLQIWQASLVHGTHGVATRLAISKAVPSIAITNGLTPYRDMTFQELVEAFDRAYVDSCEDWNKCLFEIVDSGNRYALRYALIRAPEVLQYYKLIPRAIKHEETKMAIILIERESVDATEESMLDPLYPADMYVYLSMAVAYNNMKLAKFLIAHRTLVDQAVLDRARSKEMIELLEDSHSPLTMMRVDFKDALGMIIFEGQFGRVKLYMKWGAPQKALREAYETYAEELNDDELALIESYLD